MQYHDLGNFIYALAMWLMWLEFGEHGYNHDTIGDIFEGIFVVHEFYGTEWDPGCTSAHALLESYLRQVTRCVCSANDRIWVCSAFMVCAKVAVRVLAASAVNLN